MDSRALLDGVVRTAVAAVRSGSKPGDRHILWRPEFRRDCDAITDIALSTCARSSGLCDGFHSLLARSKRLSNVGSASARGGARIS